MAVVHVFHNAGLLPSSSLCALSRILMIMMAMIDMEPAEGGMADTETKVPSEENYSEL